MWVKPGHLVGIEGDPDTMWFVTNVDDEHITLKAVMPERDMRTVRICIDDHHTLDRPSIDLLAEWVNLMNSRQPSGREVRDLFAS